MIKHLILWLLLFGGGFTQILFAQCNLGLGLNYQSGMAIPNHPRYPKLNDFIHRVELEFSWSPDSMQYWKVLYPKSNLSFVCNWSSLGNNEQLGHAFAVAPVWNSRILSGKKWELSTRLGWGIAYLTRRFDSFENPENIAIGSHWNAYAMAGLNFSARYGRWRPHAALLVAHYSNGSLRPPNLGVNLVLGQLGLRYHLENSARRSKSIRQLPDFKQRWTGMLQLGLGFNAIENRGLLHPVYLLRVGASWQYSQRALAGVGLEYGFNEANYQWISNNQGNQVSTNDFHRGLFWMSHEFLIGQLGFHTLGGIYLNKFAMQKSRIATELGLNFYPRSTYLYPRHQCWVGVKLRAYTGLAEYMALVIGYRY